jgi:hypothetical protein
VAARAAIRHRQPPRANRSVSERRWMGAVQARIRALPAPPPAPRRSDESETHCDPCADRYQRPMEPPPRALHLCDSRPGETDAHGGQRSSRGDGHDSRQGYRTVGHPRQPAGGRTARGGRGARRRQARAGGTRREGTRHLRGARLALEEGRHRLLRDDVRAAGDRRLRVDGLAGRPRGVDARAPGLRAVDVRRQRPREAERGGAGRHHAVLADEQRGFVGAPIPS